MIGIIIVNYNSYNNTIKCVQSVIENCHKIEKKIYVIDNGSTNNSFEILHNEYSKANDISVIQCERNGGYSYGLNVGMKNAIAEGCNYFLLCNNDLMFPENSIKRLLDINIKLPEIGVIGGLIVGVNGEMQKSYKIRMSYCSHLKEKKPFCYFVRRKHKKELDLSKKCIFDGMVSGACFLLSKNTIDKIGLLDENIFLFYEEDALSYKLYSSNLKAYIDPSIKIIHFGSTTIGTNGATYYFNRYKSSLYVLSKYMHVRGIKLYIVFLVDYLSLFIKSLKDHQYYKSVKELSKFYKKLER